jgi:hypothetical protein
MGSIQLLYITDTEMVKEISLCTSLSLGKPSFLSKDRGPLLGRGILSSSGPIWAHQRKTIAPELYIDKVKVNFCLFTMNKYIFHTHFITLIGNIIIMVFQIREILHTTL